MPGFKTIKLDSASSTRDEDTGADWITLRHQLGVTAFGINAWRAPEPGLQVIVDHDEADSLHQEVYVVVALGSLNVAPGTPGTWLGPVGAISRAAKSWATPSGSDSIAARRRSRFTVSLPPVPTVTPTSAS